MALNQLIPQLNRSSVQPWNNSNALTIRKELANVPRMDAEYDSYLDTLVNYSALSPETLRMLTQMGVNRPETDAVLGYGEDDANDELNSMISLYRYYLENLAPQR